MYRQLLLCKFSAWEILPTVHMSYQRSQLVVRQETDGTSNGFSIATQLWGLGMMCIISNERIAFCAQVEGTRGEIFATSRIALQSRCMRVLNEPILTYGESWP
jgi:hypothetical protein